MRKIDFSFWVVTGISIGSTLGVAFDNIPAGVLLGASTGMLAFLLSVLKRDKTNK